MTKFIREVGGELEDTENISKLQDLACTRKPAFDVDNVDIKNLIAQTHVCSIELIHLIQTEDQIKNVNKELSDELKTYSKNVANEFMQQVLDPFCKNVVKFLKKHPEYVVKSLNMNSGVETGVSVVFREFKDALNSMMKGEI